MSVGAAEWSTYCRRVPNWTPLAFAASVAGLAGCGPDPARTPGVPVPCPAPSKKAGTAALHRIRADLNALDPEAIDACVVGFMGGALLARFESKNREAPAFVGTPLPETEAAALLGELRGLFPHRIGETAWSVAQSGAQTSPGHVERRVLFRGPGDSYLYILDWAS